MFSHNNDPEDYFRKSQAEMDKDVIAQITATSLEKAFSVRRWTAGIALFLSISVPVMIVWFYNTIYKDLRIEDRTIPVLLVTVCLACVLTVASSVLWRNAKNPPR